ncbi:Rqc2 [Kluyveromyces lactis]|nr:Rqc2 [Kluyveromyces lactis]
MKQRLSSLDLQLISKELENQIVGFRLRNIYNIADSNRQFLLKFGKPDSKLNVVIDCGLRVHTTDFTRPIPPTPSWFVSKLRSYLKEKRLTAVKQIPNDRIIVFTFADGKFYLVLEFFSAGNVLLLDADQKILLLQRVVDDYSMKVGEFYNTANFVEINQTSTTVPDPKEYFENEIEDWLKEADVKAKSTMVPGEAKNGKGKGKASVPSIQKLLFVHAPHLSSDLIQNSLKAIGIDPSSSCLEFKDNVSVLVDLMSSLEVQANNLISTTSTRLGYIVAHKNKLYDPLRDKPELEYTYSNFHPFKPFVGDSTDVKIIEIGGMYNNTVDTFFSTIESNKYASRIQNQDFQAQKKLDEAKNNNETIIKSLLHAQQTNEEKGNILIANANLVEEAKNAVKNFLDQQMDWQSMETLIANEQRKGNKIARIIKLPMDLPNNKITIELPKDGYSEEDSTEHHQSESDFSSDESDVNLSDSSVSSDYSDSDFEGLTPSESKQQSRRKAKLTSEKRETVLITVDLSLSAFANASSYFNAKKATSEKQKKVEKNAEKALKSIQQKIEKDLQKKSKESHDILKAIRTPYFFEKYYWFISSESFLVLMGKSPVETDQLYAKYVNDDDIMVTNAFDVKAWILNPQKTEVPPNTLMQAGTFANSASDAWSKKIASSPWWCFAKNVTKFDDIDGSVLSVGSFRMKQPKDKNMLPPAQLVMGLGLVWKVKTEDSEEKEGEYEQNSDFEASDDDTSHSCQLETNPVDHVDNNVDVISKKINDLGFDANNFDEVALAGEEATDGYEKLSNGDLSKIEEDFDESKTIATSVVENMNTAVRGKRGKLKKIQKKYFDQDDEERLLRLEALGTLKGIEREKQKKLEEMERAEKREFKKRIRKNQEQTRILQFNKSEKVEVDIPKILNQLKTSISKDDEIADVIPVYAPWAALTKHKYKVKIQPGTAKKSKSINETLHYFLNRTVDSSGYDKDLDWPREHETIKLIKTLDVVPVICSDKLKISIPGGNDKASSGRSHKSKQSMAKGKKSKK